VVLLPARSELMYPGIDEPTMKNPSFFRWCFTKSDLQHDGFLKSVSPKNSFHDWATPDDGGAHAIA